MKFAEMPYQRVDTDAVVAGLKELTQELKAAKSGEEQFAIHQKFYELRDEYSTMIQIAMIRSDVDTQKYIRLSSPVQPAQSCCRDPDEDRPEYRS